jgi:hypothetical protein
MKSKLSPGLALLTWTLVSLLLWGAIIWLSYIIAKAWF